MSEKSDHSTSRRRFLMGGLGSAASLATVAIAATAVAQPESKTIESKADDDTVWVGAGYLMARPVKRKDVV